MSEQESPERGRNSGAHFRHVFETSQDGILIGDGRGGIMDVNPSFCRMLGRKREEMVGTSWDTVLQRQNSTHLASLRSDFAQGAAHRVELDLNRADGARFPAEIIASLAPDGRLICTIRDLSERQASEDARRAADLRYRQLFESARHGVVVSDDRGYLIDVNPALCATYGYARGALLGRPMTSFVPKAHWARLAEGAAQAFTDGSSSGVLDLLHADGSVREAEFLVIPTPDGGVLTILRDTTEQRRAAVARAAVEEALRETQAQLDRFAHVSTLGEMAAMIAHEINQPLGAVATNSEAALRWLKRSPPDVAEVEGALKRIVRDTHRATDVVKRTRRLLARGELDRGTVDLGMAVGEVIALMGRDLRQAKVTVTDVSEPSVPPVLGDRIQLQQVMINLILNAVDAMRPIRGRPRVLKIGAVADGDVVRVTVEDSGPGLRGIDTETLFQPFYTTKVAGTGLGLGLCRSIVEAHGGRIWAEPAAAGGAVFTFTLPASTVAAP